MAAANWSSLPSDLVRRIADAFLTTTDLDYYTTLRAVCHNWRAATAGPHGPDPRFRPHRWIILDEAPKPPVHDDDEDAARLFLSFLDNSRFVLNLDVDGSLLFLNLDTGRFLRRRLPVLRNYRYLATANGLLVLQDLRDYFMRLCVLNPFTGFLVRFRVPPSDLFDGSAVVAGNSPMVLFNFFDFHLAWADQTSVLCPPVATPTPALLRFTAEVGFQGRAYVANMTGSVAVIEICPRYKTPEITIIVAGNRRSVPTFLLDNAGELLLVRLSVVNPMEVFRVDLVSKALEPVTSIGSRALFLGIRCSLSVDAARLPAVDEDCVYYGDGLLCEPGVCRKHIGGSRDGTYKDESLIPHTGDIWKCIDPSASRPMSLPHVLVSYCMGSTCC